MNDVYGNGLQISVRDGKKKEFSDVTCSGNAELGKLLLYGTGFFEKIVGEFS